MLYFNDYWHVLLQWLLTYCTTLNTDKLHNIDYWYLELHWLLTCFTRLTTDMLYYTDDWHVSVLWILTCCTTLTTDTLYYSDHWHVALPWLLKRCTTLTTDILHNNDYWHWYITLTTSMLHYTVAFSAVFLAFNIHKWLISCMQSTGSSTRSPEEVIIKHTPRKHSKKGARTNCLLWFLNAQPPTRWRPQN